MNDYYKKSYVYEDRKGNLVMFDMEDEKLILAEFVNNKLNNIQYTTYSINTGKFIKSKLLIGI